MIQTLLKSIKRSIQLIVGKAIVKAVYDGDSEEIQKMQVSLLAGELRDRVDRFQNYGFTSHPHPGAEAAVVFAGGNRDRGIILAVDDRRYRIKSLKPGEVAIYTDEGDSIQLKRNRTIEVETQTYRVNTKLFEVNATDSVLNTNTFKVFNKSNDLIQVLSDWMQHTIAAKTTTLAGPQPLIGANFPTIKGKHDAFIKK